MRKAIVTLLCISLSLCASVSVIAAENDTEIIADAVFEEQTYDEIVEDGDFSDGLDEDTTVEPTSDIENISDTTVIDAEFEESLEQAAQPSVSYRTHVQRDGWQNFVQDGVMSGTQGQSKRLEGIEIKVTSGDLGIRYKTHIQTYGWETSWKENGVMSGTSGQSKRLEAIRIELTGADAADYDVWYCVHAQNFGWLNWAKNGADAGTAGYAYRLEGIKIKILPKGSASPAREGNTAAAFYSKTDGPAVNTSISGVTYNTHVQSYGWQDYVYNGDMAGTSGQSKRLEGIHIFLSNPKYPGGIEYRTHIQTYGWETNWKRDGQMSGTSGESKRLEAIEIRLTGEMAQHYDVYYCVHAQTYGWLDWAKNGEMAGTSGLAKRLEGIKIVLKEKNSTAPGSTEKAAVTGDTAKPDEQSPNKTPDSSTHIHNWTVTARTPIQNVGGDFYNVVNKKSVCSICGAEIIADEDNGNYWYRVKLTYIDEKKNSTVITDSSSCFGYIAIGNRVLYRAPHTQSLPTTLFSYDLGSKERKEVSIYVKDFRVIDNKIYFNAFNVVPDPYSSGYSYTDMYVKTSNLDGTGVKEICRVDTDKMTDLEIWMAAMCRARHTGNYMVIHDNVNNRYYKVNYANGSVSECTAADWNSIGADNAFSG